MTPTTPALIQQVQDMYTRFPYPPPGVQEGVIPNAALLDYARFVLWPGREGLAGLRVLDAGCGTGLTAATIARDYPDVEVTAIDLSETSLAHTRALADRFGVGTNLHLHVLPIEEVSALGEQFDYILSVGVLHHLESPERGLRALTDVLKPMGGIFLMLYATYGRAGIYLLQDAMRVLGAESDFADRVTMARSLAQHLPPDHPFNGRRWNETRWQEDAGIVDLLLNVRDRSYTVPQVYALLESAGLTLARFMHPPSYEPATYVSDPTLQMRFAELDAPTRAGLAELLSGQMPKHSFYATHAAYVPYHPRPEGLVVLAMKPSRSPFFAWNDLEKTSKKGRQLTRLAERPVSDTCTRSFEFSPWNMSVLAECDGHRTALDIFSLLNIQKVIPGNTSDEKLQLFGELMELLAGQEVVLCEP
jgi:SAM-dependent methyltransferase